MATLVKTTRSTGVSPRYRVWVAINPPGNMYYYAVSSPVEARQFIKEEAARQLRNPRIFANAFGLEELEDDGKYHEWYDEDGNDIGYGED